MNHKNYPVPTAAPWVHQNPGKHQINGNTKRAMIAAAAKRIQAKYQVKATRPVDDQVKYVKDKTLTSLVFSRPQTKERV